MQFLQRQTSRLIHFSDGVEFKNNINNSKRRSQYRGHRDESGCESNESEDELFHLEIIPDHFPGNSKNNKNGLSSFGEKVEADYEEITRAGILLVYIIDSSELLCSSLGL